MPRSFFFRLLSAATPAGDHVPDAELLRRFVRDGDAAGFELLVRRHADAVWTACRRVLRSEADAEDAFQATFLVLARKAGSVRGACVGGWLYRVAVNAALRLRERSARVGAVDPRTLAAMPDNPAAEPDVELAAVVQEELARLPERYRLPVVLCDLEGHTHAEAAKVLRWPVGSVSGRLSRARGLLRDRLARRGMTALAALAAVLVPAGSAPAGAVQAATAAAAGRAPVPTSVLTLTEGVLSAMRTAKLKLAAVAAGLLGLAGAGTYATLAQNPATPSVKADPPAPADAKGKGPAAPAAPADPGFTAFPDFKPPEFGERRDARKEYDVALAKLCPRMLRDEPIGPAPNDDPYRRLLKARIHNGQVEVRQTRARVRIGQHTPDMDTAYALCLNDVREAATELWADDPKSLVPWLEEFVVLAKEVERVAQNRVEVGSAPPYTLNAARRHRLQAETALWKAKHPRGK